MREIDHNACRDLLPWYVNGTLPAAEERALDRHLEDCPACREELEACVRLSREVERDAGPAPSAHPAQLAKLLERIDRGELDVPEPDGASRPRTILAHQVVRWFRNTPAPVRWLAAAQAAAILVLGVSLWLAPATAPGDAAFRTLSAETTSQAPRRVRVVFAPETQETEIRRLLLGIRAEIVGGPSPLGAYAIALDRVALGESNDSVLELLRADPRVVLAEPVIGDDAPPR